MFFHYQNNVNNTFGDRPIPHVNNSSITKIDWAPSNVFGNSAQYLAASSWDGEIRCWKIDNAKIDAQFVGMKNHERTVLDISWGPDDVIFSASCDKTVKMWNIGTNFQKVVAAHGAPIKCVNYSRESKSLLTAGWDRVLSKWDPFRSNNTGTPVLTFDLQERAYCSDLNGPFAAVGTADRNIYIFDVRQTKGPMKKMTSSLRYQTRCVKLFPNNKGVAVGSIEGRVGIMHMCEDQQQNDFAFKCHRHNGLPREGKGDERVVSRIHAINDISFNYQYGTFATAGSDGCFHFWDKEQKQRLKQFVRLALPITSCAFSPNGKIFAYAASYDYHQGRKHHYAPYLKQRNVFLHEVKEKEIRGRRAIVT
jgi:mRNA export factor